MDDDELCGCDLDFCDPSQISSDDDLTALVLFADVNFLDPEAVQARVAEYEALSAVGAL